MNLRPYQTEAVAAIRLAFSKGHRRVLLQGATGMGKSLIFAHIAEQAGKRGKRILILVHRRELLLQASRTLREIGVAHGLIAPGFPYTNHPVRVASIQTLVRRLGNTPRPDLIVYDEAHHATSPTSLRVLNHYPSAHVLGVTATPARTDGRGLGEVFTDLILGPSMSTLVDGGYLAPCEVWAPPRVVDLRGIKVTAGDFDRHEVADRMDKPTITGDAVGHYQRLAAGKRAIAFVTTIEHAGHVAEAFKAALIPAESIDGKIDPKERDAIMARFRAGVTLVLVSCELVGEGVDVPAVEAAILLRPTESVIVYLQQVGRAMRPAPGKTRAVVLDHVGNCERHGLPESDRTWTLEGRKKQKSDRVPPMSRCPACFACFRPGPEVCPMCGAALPKKEREVIASVPGELKRVDPAAYKVKMLAQKDEEARCVTYEDFLALGTARGYGNPRGWAWVRLNARRERA